MRKPLVALSLAATAGLWVIPTTGTLAAPANTTTLATRPTTPAPVSSSESLASSTSNAVSGAQIVQTALRYLGYPYTATGNSPATGFSCIGFVSFVYRSNGIQLPGDLGGALAYAARVPFSNLQPGDILYFQNTVWTGLSHAAIYIGGGRFVHSEYFGVGVRISSFNNDPKDGNYWIAHYLGANRPWGGASVAPVIRTPVGGPSVAPGVATTTVVGGKQAVVVVSSLNVRAGPSLQNAVQTVIPRGTTVVIKGQSRGWYLVQLPDGTTGWVIKAGISKGAAPTTAVTTNPNVGTPTAPVRAGFPAKRTPAVHRATASIRVSGLRVHTSPSIGAPVVTSVGAGQRVQVLARGNGWVKVRTSTGAVGWVVAGYTSVSHRTSASPVYRSTTPSRPLAAVRHSTSTRGPVLTAGVRVHAAPGLRARVVGLAAAGTHVTVLGRSGAWTLVRLPSGRIGYVYAAYVR